jgi:predicted metal-dependent phosphoesterase TrpH
MIDLHVHSTFSDGSLTPEQLAAKAAQVGLTAVGLTDHDCTGGLARFAAACAREGVRPVPGVEISANVEHGTLHILGYLMDVADEALQRTLEEIRDGRHSRNLRILARLNELGLALEWDEVARHAGEDIVSRPHFARAMVERGYVKDTVDACDRFLGKGQPAYVDRLRLSAEDSVRLIRDAGGLAVLAHPFTLDLKPRALRAFVLGLRNAGLDGIESYYSEYSSEQQQTYLAMAADLGLLATGGSDFHGDPNPAIRLGTGFGGLSVPDALADALFARAAGRGVRSGVAGRVGTGPVPGRVGPAAAEEQS